MIHLDLNQGAKLRRSKFMNRISETKSTIRLGKKMKAAEKIGRCTG
jgi:hypothetical protein